MDDRIKLHERVVVVGAEECYRPFPAIRQVDPDEYMLLEPWRVEVPEMRLTVRVTPGYIFDGASIPKIGWLVVGSPFTGLYPPAALTHDILYEAELLPREECDKVFLDMMRHYGVSNWKSWLMFKAVRNGGGSPWRRHTAMQIENARRLGKVEKH